MIAPGLDLPTRFVIHAVGPRWSGGENGELEVLYSAYRSSLHLAKENEMNSIGFPLISAGVFGYPVELAWERVVRACRDFLGENEGYEMEITFAVLDEGVKEIGEGSGGDLRTIPLSLDCKIVWLLVFLYDLWGIKHKLSKKRKI